MTEAARVVLDTNVLLSLYVFANSRYAPLRERLDAGELMALTDERCLGEFRRVLAYPMFSLDDNAQRAVFESFGRHAVIVATAADPVPLPECADADDQKFLEVARDGLARWLVTSDKALLRLARRRKLAHLFEIITPEQALTR